MPPVERSEPRRQVGELERLDEDAGMMQEGPRSNQKPAEYLREDTGESERKEGDKRFVDEARDKLAGQKTHSQRHGPG